MKLKPFIQRSDGSAKGDWDVGITLDVIEAAASTDIIVLASGDGDFDLLLRKARERYGVEYAFPPHCRRGSGKNLAPVRCR